MRNILFNEKEDLFKIQTGIEFQSTFKKYYPKLVFYVNKMCRDEQVAEDISMDAFMMSLDKIQKYDKTKSQFSTWLFTIAKNITLQNIKKSRKCVSIDNEVDNDGTTMKDFIEYDYSNNDQSNFENILEKKANVMKIEINKLKDPYKTVIEMREIEKMAYKEISEKLGRNLSTIKSQIRGARKILIQKTEKEFELIDQHFD